MRRKIQAIIISFSLFVFIQATILAQSIIWIDSIDFPFSRAYDLSDDGSVVVGDYIVSNPYLHHQAFRWQINYGFIDLGIFPGLDTHSYGVSADGSIVVGCARDNIWLYRAFYWTDSSGIVDIGTLGGDEAIAYDISSDGSVIVGESEDLTCGQLQAFRWIKNIRMVNLGSFCNCCVSFATAVSADGNVVVGYAEYETYHSAFRWTSATGLQDLGRFGGHQSEAYGISTNGEYIVGRSDFEHPNGLRSHAFYWTSSTGMIDIHNNSLGFGSRAFSVSDDGKKIVGEVLNEGITQAFLWSQQDGMNILKDLYSGLITYGSEFYSATKISPDGRFIIGYGRNSSTGREGAFIIDTSPIINVDKNDSQIPKEFYLLQNYPNPFNPSTKIRYSIPRSTEYYSVQQRVTLKVYDILGNEVATLVDEEKPGGTYEVEFSASHLSSGIYFYRLTAGGFTQTKKMVLLR